jgi:hypothetical protein
MKNTQDPLQAPRLDASSIVIQVVLDCDPSHHRF